MVLMSLQVRLGSGKTLIIESLQLLSGEKVSKDLIRSGEKEAIVEILSEYSSGLILFLNSITGNMSLSEDIAEDVFCELLLKKPGYSSKSSFKTWLYAIARYKAFHLMKRKKRFSDSPVYEMYDLADKEDLERKCLKTEQKIQLHKLLRISIRIIPRCCI